jgi:hypothetical protein
MEKTLTYLTRPGGVVGRDDGLSGAVGGGFFCFGILLHLLAFQRSAWGGVFMAVFCQRRLSLSWTGWDGMLMGRYCTLLVSYMQ